MKKLLIVLMVIFALMACSTQQVKAPSICEPWSLKVADLKAYAADKYQVAITDDRMLLCEIANSRNIHLEATGDLVLVADTIAVRSVKAYTKNQAILVFLGLKDTFLAAARGQTVINSGDLYEIAALYASDYPELGIALQYTDLLRAPQWANEIPTSLDFMALVWWCDKNLKILNHIK